MGVCKISLKKLSDYYLFGLLTRGNYQTDPVAVKEEIASRMKKKSSSSLLSLWRLYSERSAVRPILEEQLALRYQNYQGSYETLPLLAKEFFQEVGSVDAIVTLTYAKNDQIQKQAMGKYHDIMEEYLSCYNELYQTEGEDLSIVSLGDNKKEIDTDRIKTPAKIYKMSDYQLRRK